MFARPVYVYQYRIEIFVKSSYVWEPGTYVRPQIHSGILARSLLMIANVNFAESDLIFRSGMIECITYWTELESGSGLL